MSAALYTLDDLESDLCHLHHLLDVVTWKQQEAFHDGNAGQYQIDALTWIARDMVDRLAQEAGSLAGKYKLAVKKGGAIGATSGRAAP